MADDAPDTDMELDEDAPLDAPPKQKKKDRTAQNKFNNLLQGIKAKITALADKFPRSSIVVAIDSPFAYNSFRLIASRHCADDPTWDHDIIEALKEAIVRKTKSPHSKLETFNPASAAITHERLLAALQRCVAEGDVAANQYTLILKTVEKMEKEEKTKAQESE